MNKLFFIIIIAFSSLLFACDDSSSPSKSNLSLVSSITNTQLNNSVNVKVDAITNEIQSIKIESLKILLSNIKVKLDDTERNVHLGPALFTVTDSTRSVEFASTELPEGAMDKIKFEIHRFASSELSSYANDPIFKDFATNDRFTIMIKGVLKSNNVDTPFSYNTEIVGNLTYDFAPPLTIEDGKNMIVEFQFQSEQVFKDKGVILDPNDSKNKSYIDNQIKTALKALVK